MSERTEIVRLSFDAYRRGDLDVFAGWMHPDIEIHDWPESPDPRVYHGVNAIVEARDEWGKAWEYMYGIPTRFVETSDRVLAFIHMTGKGRGSEIAMELDTYGVFTFRGPKVSKVQYFTDREAALAAAGLTEEQIRQEAT